MSAIEILKNLRAVSTEKMSNKQKAAHAKQIEAAEAAAAKETTVNVTEVSNNASDASNEGTSNEGTSSEGTSSEGTSSEGTDTNTNDNASEGNAKPEGEGTESTDIIKSEVIEGSESNPGSEGTDTTTKSDSSEGTDTTTKSDNSEGTPGGNVTPKGNTIMLAKPAPKAASAATTNKGKGSKPAGVEYNVGMCRYSELVVGKDGNYKYLPYILCGVWQPTFNGQENTPVDATRPQFKTMEEAIKANAVEFGMNGITCDKDMVKNYHYAQNTELLKEGYPTTGRVHPEGHKNAGEIILFDCFITATAENLKAVVANMKRYLDHPSTKGTKALFTMLDAPYQVTYQRPAPVALDANGLPIVEAATATAATATTTAATTENAATV